MNTQQIRKAEPDPTKESNIQRTREISMIHSFGAHDRYAHRLVTFDEDRRHELTPENTFVHDPEEMEDFKDIEDEEYKIQHQLSQQFLASCTDLHYSKSHGLSEQQSQSNLRRNRAILQDN